MTLRAPLLPARRRAVDLVAPAPTADEKHHPTPAMDPNCPLHRATTAQAPGKPSRAVVGRRALGGLPRLTIRTAVCGELTRGRPEASVFGPSVIPDKDSIPHHARGRNRPTVQMARPADCPSLKRRRKPPRWVTSSAPCEPSGTGQVGQLPGGGWVSSWSAVADTRCETARVGAMRVRIRLS